ncbi:hypothetical protein NE865_07381 [Phthorimaea operculella]|nr:hypothetical protein NE865_07381 [Phthorimaea operculella]
MFKTLVMLFCFLASTHSFLRVIRQFTKSNRLYTIPDDDDMLLFWKTSGTKPCSPFEASYIRCNRCVCGADSVLYCTRIICMRHTADYEYELETVPYHQKGRKHKRKIRHRRRRKHHKSKENYYNSNPFTFSDEKYWVK